MAKRTLTSIEIPQADSLENVRRVVETIASGSSSRKEISDQTDVSLRHVDYAIHAAKSLGFLSEGSILSLTDSGRALVASERGSSEEREQLRAAFKANEVLEMLAPDLLDESAPSKSALTERIQQACPDLSEATAMRRAQTLLAWRSQALASPSPVLLDAPAPVAKPAAEKKAPAPKKAAAPKAAPAPKAAKPAAKKAAAKPAAKPAAKKAEAKPAAKKADAKPAAKKAEAKPAAKPAAKKAAAKPAAKKAAAPKAAAKPAAKKAAAKPAAKKAEAKKADKPAAPSAEAGPVAEAPAAREITYEPDADAGPVD